MKSLVQKVRVKWPVLLFDLISIPVAWCFAYWLRYNLDSFKIPLDKPSFYYTIGLLIGVQASSYYYFKVYRGLWHFASLKDLIRILKSVTSAALIVIPIYFLTSLLGTIPRSVLPLYCLLLVTFLCSARLLARILWDYSFQHRDMNGKRVLVIGAGRAASSLIRDLSRIRSYRVIGILDDNPAKKRLEIHGVQVLANIDALEHLLPELNIELVFIAIPSATSTLMRRIVAHCDHCKIPYRTLPSIHALASGQVTVNNLRDVRIEDLLGRDQVKLNWEKIETSIHDKRVLVTGGGGSIGSELCRQIMKLNPELLIIVDLSEYSLYAIEMELKRSFPGRPIALALLSVNDEIGVDQVLAQYKPAIIFHAAAYKHVPLLEDQIRTAVNNNIIGTQVMCEASVIHGVEKFILISTDKAVNPTNVMGATKRVAELYCQNLNLRVDTQFITVRFGNVLDSVGSVVPLFKQQLKEGGPLTVTHPDMERYFMTIPEASQLILQAMCNGTGGEIYVLDMGEPVKISYLAEQMIRLAGKTLGKDIQIQYIGLRPGEKLFEELFHDCEQLAETPHEKIFKAHFREVDWEELSETISFIKRACYEHHNDALIRFIQQLVPEFNYQTEFKHLHQPQSELLKLNSAVESS